MPGYHFVMGACAERDTMEVHCSINKTTMESYVSNLPIGEFKFYTYSGYMWLHLLWQLGRARGAPPTLPERPAQRSLPELDPGPIGAAGPPAFLREQRAV